MVANKHICWSFRLKSKTKAKWKYQGDKLLKIGWQAYLWGRNFNFPFLVSSEEEWLLSACATNAGEHNQILFIFRYNANTLNTKFRSICHRLPRIPMSNYGPPPHSNPRCSGPRGSKMVIIEMSAPHSYSTSIHTIRVSCCRLATIYNVADDRQSDWNRLPML